MFVRRTVRRGDTLSFSLSLETDQDGQPWVSFVGYRVSFTLKATFEQADSDAVVRLNSDGEGGILTGASATWTVGTDALLAGERYAYDVQLVHVATGRTSTLEAGYIVVAPDVTGGA